MFLFRPLISACTLMVFLQLPHPLRAEVNLPIGTKLAEVDFERHVMGLFGKTGCNNGSCHGSFQGKNGFRLSLFGYEPEKDYAALTREIHGRRVDRIAPENSLLLQKAIGHIPHEGGTRFSKESWQYDIFRAWIEQGAKWTKGSGQIQSITVEPKEYAFCPPGQTLQLQVKATFTDETTEDITPFCDFRIMDDAVANVSSLGQVTSVRPGDTGLVVAYRGVVQAIRVLVPAPVKEGFTYPQVPEVNFIDTLVLEKLRKMNMVPSELASDGEFLRRLYVDTIGSLPSPDEIRSFLADTNPNKREKKIDELLQHPLHAALWATKLSDITGNNTDALENPQQMKSIRSQLWHDWLRKRIQDNMPYDQLVRQILTATSRDSHEATAWLDEVKKLDADLAKGFQTEKYVEKPTLDLFWRRQQQVPNDQWGQKIAAAFLGVRLECAECHKHPTDRWTQADYRAFANFFSYVRFGNNDYSSPELKKLVDAENAERRKKLAKNNNQVNLIRELYVNTKPANLLAHPDTGRVLTPKTLGGPEIPAKSGSDIREELFQWMAQPENPFFARSFVNRVWAHYLGIGLVDPVDDFSLANPPSNARLLDALAKDFRDSKFDLRSLEKRILMSRTYQLSSKANESNKFDKVNYAKSYIRPMMAEVVIDVLNTALGVQENFGNDAPANKRMIEIGASRFNNNNLTYVLRIFGRPPRTTACDCERTMDPALPQTLYRMTDQGVLTKLKAPDNRLNQLLKAKKSDEEILEELFLATLSRLPRDKEKQAFLEHRSQEKDRLVAFTDTLWALINTREFILNH